MPKEYAGIWDKPEDMARVMRALVPSSLEVGGKRHAALALARYAPVTSPLRRYTDLVNEAQVLHFITEGSPIFEKEALEKFWPRLILFWKAQAMPSVFGRATGNCFTFFRKVPESGGMAL